jgi:hypothetical protein
MITIEQYSFGSITISGKRYSSDLMIINGEVYSDWWRKSGHSVDVDDVGDILDAKPDYLVIGSGSSGLMKVSTGLNKRCDDCGIEFVVEPTSVAVETFNRMLRKGQNVAGAFHLTC